MMKSNNQEQVKENLYQKRVRFTSLDQNRPSKFDPSRFRKSPSVTQTNTFHIGEYCKKCGAIRIGPSIDAGCKNCLVSKPDVQQRRKSEFLSRCVSEQRPQSSSNSKSEYLSPISFRAPPRSSSKNQLPTNKTIILDDEIVIPKITLKNTSYLEHSHYEQLDQSHLDDEEDDDYDDENDLDRTEEVNPCDFKVDSFSQVQVKQTKTKYSEITSNVVVKSQLNPVPTKMRQSTQSSVTNDLACYACQGTLRPGDTAICAEDVDKKALWHPRCFQCSVCNEPLIDLTYFTKNSEIFCEKHYQEQQKQCSSCNKGINSSEYISAENKYWHLEHFKCCNCNSLLANEKYLSFDQNVYCSRCHEKLFPKFCQTCKEKISVDEVKFTYEELHWHSDPFCFKCSCCDHDLLECHFLIKKNRLFCGLECKRRFFKK